MDKDIARQVYVIDDLLEGRTREVGVLSDELFISPHYRGERLGFSDRIFYLGVVSGFGNDERPGKFQGKPFIEFDPFYQIVVPEDRNFANTKFEEWKSRNRPYVDFFRTLYTGPAEAIGEALRKAPFSGMEQLAVAIEGLEPPYKLTLRDLIEYRVRELAAAG